MLNSTLFESSSEKLIFYSPYQFLRDVRKDKLYNPILGELSAWGQPNQLFCEVDDAQFFYTYLTWDSTFFNIKTAKLNFVLHKLSFQELTNACIFFLDQVRKEGFEYLFCEIPPEDVLLIQALNLAGLKSTETRLIYFHDQIQQFQAHRFNVRAALEADIPNLRLVASTMRNQFDRFHADPVLGETHGDDFLARYIEEGVKGYSDIVLVPDEQGVSSDAFFSLNLLEKNWEQLGVKVSKIVLTAASSSNNKGWHYKLLAESTHWFKEKGAEVVFMPTQSTNRAVIRNCEKLGYKYGGSSHVLTWSSKL